MDKTLIGSKSSRKSYSPRLLSEKLGRPNEYILDGMVIKRVEISLCENNGYTRCIFTIMNESPKRHRIGELDISDDGITGNA